MNDPSVLPKHAIIANVDNIVTITPGLPSAEVRINGKLIHETTILRGDTIVRIGRNYCFRYREQSQMVRNKSIKVLPVGIGMRSLVSALKTR